MFLVIQLIQYAGDCLQLSQQYPQSQKWANSVFHEVNLDDCLLKEDENLATGVEGEEM